MQASLREKLTAAGVPPERQHRAGLARYFPPEFRVEEAQLDDDMLAEVLLVFLQHGVLSLAQELDAATMSRRATGNHVCQFYRAPDELLEFAVAFLERGLEMSQRCVWALPCWLTRERAEAALDAAKLGGAVTEGRIVLFGQAEVYADGRGDLKPGDELLEFWRGMQRRARTEGFAGLRVVGDASAWGGPAEGRFLDYERALQPTTHPTELVVLCTFSLPDARAEWLAAALREHDCGVVNRRGAWDEIRAGDATAEVLRALAGGAS